MRQRVMIAIALACRPKLLIADEPTSALDVTVQAQIMALLDTIQRETGVAILLISHNLALVGSFCNRVAVMYGGDLVELGSVENVLGSPRHPYTRGLLACMPQEIADARAREPFLRDIPGQVPPVEAFALGCRFSDRCSLVKPECVNIRPAMRTYDADAGWRCIYPITPA
jgi:oligopeptide/dipeptide ABC transporter ATP-binding protein